MHFGTSLCWQRSKSYGFFSSHVWMWELDRKESWAPKNWCIWSWAPKNWCIWTMVLEKTLESPLDCKEIKPGNQSVQNIHGKDWCWSWSYNTLTTQRDELTRWKRSWCWERLKTEGEGDDRGWDGCMASPTEGDDRGWDGWMASLTRWTWVWARSGSWSLTGKPGVL